MNVEAFPQKRADQAEFPGGDLLNPGQDFRGGGVANLIPAGLALLHDAFGELDRLTPHNLRGQLSQGISQIEVND